MNSPFFLSRFWPTIVLLFMGTTYVACVHNGVSTPYALTAAAYAGLASLVLAVGVMIESSGRNRMANPIALWTTFFMAMAPVGPAVFVTPHDGPHSMLIVIGMFVAAVAVAYLLERFIIAGRHGWWYVEYGLLPFGIAWVAGLEMAGHHVTAIITFGFYWFVHFFYKQLPQLLESAGIKWVREGS